VATTQAGDAGLDGAAGHQGQAMDRDGGGGGAGGSSAGQAGGARDGGTIGRGAPAAGGGLGTGGAAGQGGPATTCEPAGGSCFNSLASCCAGLICCSSVPCSNFVGTCQTTCCPP